jgi:LexA-binding, inner membrane-associated putative hydrolase
MPVFSHAVAASALAGSVRPRLQMPTRFWVAIAASAALPDADVVAFRLGIPYASMYGHRGFSHSLAFAAIVATSIVALLFSGRAWRRWTLGLWGCFFLAVTSHGFLDARRGGPRQRAQMGLGSIDRARCTQLVAPSEPAPIRVGMNFDRSTGRRFRGDSYCDGRCSSMKRFARTSSPRDEALPSQFCSRRV